MGSRYNRERELISKKSNGDKIILFVVIWILVTKSFWVIMPKFIENFYSETWFKPLNVLMSFIWAIIPILLAYTVKEKSSQEVLFILGAIYFIYCLYEMFQPLLFNL